MQIGQNDFVFRKLKLKCKTEEESTRSVKMPFRVGRILRSSGDLN
jgi:hypothetical protein